MNRIVGKPIERIDAADKARGLALYSGDYHMPGMLHCALVRAKVAHAKILSVRLPEMPEGCFSFTAKDVVNNIIPSICNDQPVFADDVVRYHGEPVALIAAPTLEMANELVSRAVVELEELPVLDDYMHALDSDAPQLFCKGNLCTDFHSNKGDVEKAFAESDLVYEEVFHMPMQCHGFMEPEASFSYIDEQGRLALIASTQNVWTDKKNICSALGLPFDKVTAKAGVVGGGFGGKDANTTQIYAAIATHYTGKPARFVFSREENIRYGLKRHPGAVTVKVGFGKEGKITALMGHMRLDTGAYGILGPAVLGLGLEHMTGPYFIPSVRLDGELVYTNHAPASAMRGFGAPQSAIGIETFLNRAAKELGIDPLEIRRINAIHQGQPGSMGGVMEHCTEIGKAIELFAESDFHKEMVANKDPEIGYGIAAGMMSSGMGKGVPDTCYVKIEKSGDKFIVSTSLVDIGQGGQTTLAMIAAEALGVPFEHIDMRMGITDDQQDSGSTAASRSTYVAGNAILEASKQILSGSDKAEGVFAFPEAKDNAVHAFFSFMVQGAKVKVDRSTGQVSVLAVHNVTETGNVINPEMMMGQAYGGIVMSQGYALSEQIRYRNGIAMENSVNSYVMPTSMDAPHLTNANVQAYEPTGPFGAKGVAECSTVAMAPAIIAAINQIIPDANITKLPIDRLQLIRRS